MKNFLAETILCIKNYGIPDGLTAEEVDQWFRAVRNNNNNYIKYGKNTSDNLSQKHISEQDCQRNTESRNSESK